MGLFSISVNNSVAHTALQECSNATDGSDHVFPLSVLRVTKTILSLAGSLSPPDKAKDIEIMDVIGDGKAIKEIEVSKGEISNIAKKIIWNIRELNIGERAWATIRVRVLDNSESIKDISIPMRRSFSSEIDDDTFNKTSYEEVSFDFSVSDNNTDYEKSSEQDNESSEEENVRIKEMIPRGIVYLTYIVAENEDGMYIIDQHAAAERINYEKVLKSLKEKVVVVDLLVPVKIELSASEFLIIKEYFDLLKDYGFITEEFGNNTIIVRSHPNWIFEDVSEECIRKVIDIIIEKQGFDFDQFVWRMAATMACRMSIKANDYISYDDQVYLLNELRHCENPFTCPHGRPTIITYTKYDLEKLFKRSLD